jgi:hypothetical protein
VPAVAVYSALAGLIYQGSDGALFNVQALWNTAILALICALAQDILPRSFKEFVVFWRVHDRLPGSRAFTQHRGDRFDLSRISNFAALAQLRGEEQQRVFYRIYNEHRDHPTVQQANFRYCAWRDTASLYAILAIITVPAAWAASAATAAPFKLPAAVFLASGSFVASLLTGRAARQMGSNLVADVLARETSKAPHPIKIA